MGIDWKRKLTSRKFWTAVCALITDIPAFFNCGEEVEYRPYNWTYNCNIYRNDIS